MLGQAFIEALRRYVHLVVRPEDEWNLVAAQKPSLGEAVFPFTIIGLVLSVAASLLGGVLRTGESNLLLEVGVRLVVNAGSVAAFALAAGLVVRRIDVVRPAMGEVAALYSSTGLWMASLLSFVPVLALGWLWFLMGVAYSGYLFYLALDSAVGVPGHARTRCLIAVMAALVVVSSALRVVESMLCG